jgi:hypothetical protein
MQIGTEAGREEVEGPSRYQVVADAMGLGEYLRV